jgi:adenylate cyclase
MFTGSVLFLFVTCHLINIAFGLVSLEAVETTRAYLTAPWSIGPVFAVLMLSLLIHLVLGLQSLYQRNTFRMSGYDGAQLIFGLLIMPLLASHIVGIYAAKNIFEFDPTYRIILTLFWLDTPLEGLRQVLVVIVIWLHGSIGIFSWIRLKRWWGRVSWFVNPLIVAIPVIALLGFVDAGNQIIAEAELAAQISAEAPDVEEEEISQEEMQAIEEAAAERRAAILEKVARTYRILGITLALYAAMVIVTLILRALRMRSHRRQKAIIDYLDGPTVEAEAGTSLLEISRLNDIPHANLCRGRGRCGTCRVRIVDANSDLEAPGKIEQETLARLSSPEHVRLACQLHPHSGSLTVERLVAPDISPRDMVLNQKAEARTNSRSTAIPEAADA